MANRQAFRRLKRRSDGVMGIVFIDGETGEEVTNLSGYDIIDQGIDFQATTDETDTSEEVEDDGKTSEEKWIPNGRDEQGTIVDPSQFTVGNNFGYIDKPRAVSLLGMLPGMLGLGGKAVNAMINNNNVMAVNRARGFLGLPATTSMENIKGTISDNQGYIGDVVIGKETYAIGFEGNTPDGRTTLTPMEARNRSLTKGLGLRAATVEEVEAAKADNATNGKTGFLDKLGITSPLSGLKDAIKAAIPSSPLKGVQSPLAGKTSAPGVANVLDENGIATVDPNRSPATNTPTSTGPRASKKGGGLANLVNRRGGVSFANKGQDKVDPKVQEALDAVARDIGQPLNVTSGYRDPDYNKKVGGVKGSFHMKGLAADIDMSGMDESQRQELVEELTQRGFGGFITYTGMPDTLHADMRSKDEFGNPQLMHDKSKNFMHRAPGWFQQLAETGGTKLPDTGPIPGKGLGAAEGTIAGTTMTPTGDPAPQGFVSPTGATPVPEGKPSPVEAKEITEKATEEIGKQVEQSLFGVDGGGSLGKPSKADIQKIAFTIAGELGSKTLAGIASGDPAAIQQARAEIAAITGTIMRRAKSVKHVDEPDPIGSVLIPSKYNSLFKSKEKTTSANYNKYGGFIGGAVEDYFDGKNPNPAPNRSSYHNPDISDPDWASSLKNPMRVGEHEFGDVTLKGTDIPEYREGLPKEAPIPESKPTPQVAANQTLTPAGMPGTPLAPAPVEPVSRAPLGPVSPNRTPTSVPFTPITEEQWRDAGGKPVVTPSNITGFSYVNPNEAVGTYAVQSQPFTPDTAGAVGQVGSPSGLLGAGQEYGQPGAGPLGDYTPGTIGGTGIGSYTGAGTLAGTAAGWMGSPFGTASTHDTGSLSFDFGADLGNWSSAPGGFGDAGASVVGAGMPSSFSYDGGSYESSFAGESAGSLGGTASGLGSGLGSIGQDAGAAGGFSGSAGSWGGGGTASVSTGPSPSSPAGGAQAAAGYSPSYTAESFGLGDSVGGVGAGDGDTVLCTYFHNRGWIPTEIYEADYMYGLVFTNKYTFRGYHFWAKPLVEHLRKHQGSKREKLAFYITDGWAKEMASRMGIGKPNLTGKILITLVEPLCYLIGRVLKLHYKATQQLS